MSAGVRRGLDALGSAARAVRGRGSRAPEPTVIWMDPEELPHREVVVLEAQRAKAAQEAAAAALALAASPPLATPPQSPSSAPSPEPPITDAEFEAWVEDALERVPEQFLDAVENVAFIVEHDPPGGRRNLLGLYHGVPLPGRGHYSGAMPDTITIYQNPLVRVYRTRERVKEEVYRTVVHEIGHYFGMDDDELHGLGW